MRINEENKTMDMEARDINYILPAYVRSYLFYCKNEMPEKIIFPMFPSVKVGDKDIPIEYVPPLEAVAAEIAEDGKSVAEVTSAQEAALDEKDETIKELKAEVAELETVGRGEEGLGGTQKEETTSEQLLDEAADLKLEEDTAPVRCRAYAEHWKELGKPEGWAGCSLPEGHEGAHRDETEDIQPLPAPEDLLRQQEEAAIPDKPEPTESPAKAAFAEPAEPEVHTVFKVDPDPAHQPPPDRKPNQPPGGDIGPGQPLSDMHGRDRRDQVRTARDLVEEPSIDEAKEKEFDKEVSRDEQGRPVVEDKPDAPSG